MKNNEVFIHLSWHETTPVGNKVMGEEGINRLCAGDSFTLPCYG